MTYSKISLLASSLFALSLTYTATASATDSHRHNKSSSKYGSYSYGNHSNSGLRGSKQRNGKRGNHGSGQHHGTDCPAGPAGENGIDGATGPAGPAGENGVDGATGPAGPAGEKGMDGATGPAGPAGEKGMDGADGSTSLTTYWVNESEVPGANAFVSATASCMAGDILVGCSGNAVGDLLYGGTRLVAGGTGSGDSCLAGATRPQAGVTFTNIAPQITAEAICIKQ